MIFDFYVNKNYIIEFDGIQHFTYFNSGWDTEEKFKDIQFRDNEKNLYCFNNNIPLIRIPYKKLDNLVLEDLLLDTSSFIVKEVSEINEYYQMYK